MDYKDLKGEVWKCIAGYEGLYQISNMGRVKSLEKERSNGRAIYKTPSRILNASLDKDGYEQITLYKKHSKPKTFKVHRLVAIAFIYNPFNKEEVDHINTLRNDNRVENLKWVTSRENKLNPITRERRKNVIVSIETKEKISKSRTGRFTKKNNPNYKGYVCIFPSGEVTKSMMLKEIIEYLGVNRSMIDTLVKSKEPYKVSKYTRSNKKEHLKTLEGIRVLYNKDYLAEQEVV